MAAKLCARLALSASKAPALIRLSNWRRLKLLGSSRRAKSNRSLNGPLALRSATVAFMAKRADALDRGERIADGGTLRRILDREDGVGAVDVGRQNLDAEPGAFLAEDVELVGVAEVEGHGSGDELDRVIGLEIGGLVGDQRIGRGMRFVEAVAGEFRHLLENMLGVRGIDAMRLGAVDELPALRLHLGLDLLAHGAAQQIGAASE